VVGVLQLCEFVADSPGVVVVDKGDGAHHGGGVVGGPLGYQAVSDEIAEGLGSVGIAEPRDQIIEAFEEIRIEWQLRFCLGRPWSLLGREFPPLKTRRIARLRDSWHDSPFVMHLRRLFCDCCHGRVSRNGWVGPRHCTTVF